MVFEPEKSESNLQGGKIFKGLFAILDPGGKITA
jgi:hypothetical protein